jgi:hypothetical protein
VANTLVHNTTALEREGKLQAAVEAGSYFEDSASLLPLAEGRRRQGRTT